MNNKSKKINFNHSFIFFLVCNIFSLIAFKFNTLTISPFICLLLILSIGISHGSLDNVKGRKLFQIFEIFQMSLYFQDFPEFPNCLKDFSRFDTWLFTLSKEENTSDVVAI